MKTNVQFILSLSAVVASSSSTQVLILRLQNLTCFPTKITRYYIHSLFHIQFTLWLVDLLAVARIYTYILCRNLGFAEPKLWIDSVFSRLVTGIYRVRILRFAFVWLPSLSCKQLPYSLLHKYEDSWINRLWRQQMMDRFEFNTISLRREIRI